MGGATRRGSIGVVVLAAAMAAGGLTAVHLLDAGHDAGSPAATGTPTVADQTGAKSLGPPGAGTLQLAAAPQVAIMPTHSPRPTGRPVPSGNRLTQSAEATDRVPGQGPGRTSQASSPAARAPSSAPPGSSTCTHPQYTTSDPTAMWNLSPYFVANNMWNISGYNVSQTLDACSYSDWYVVATMDNSTGNGAVKTYPNAHRDFDSEPQISSFHSVTSAFAETSPDSGSYEDAYDIWLNGIGTSTSTEVMIWTSNHGQTPSGSVQATVTLDGRSYAVWKTTGNYIAFVASTNFTAGTMNLLDFFQWLMSKGWITGTATLGQVGYGAELVSTNGVPATFTFSDFSVNAS